MGLYHVPEGMFHLPEDGCVICPKQSVSCVRKKDKLLYIFHRKQPEIDAKINPTEKKMVGREEFSDQKELG